MDAVRSLASPAWGISTTHPWSSSRWILFHSATLPPYTEIVLLIRLIWNCWISDHPGLWLTRAFRRTKAETVFFQTPFKPQNSLPYTESVDKAYVKKDKNREAVLLVGTKLGLGTRDPWLIAHCSTGGWVTSCLSLPMTFPGLEREFPSLGQILSGA